MEDNKYYIPEIDELYIGYECQWLSKGTGEYDWMIMDGHKEDKWIDTVLMLDNSWGHNLFSAVKAVKNQLDNIRTKYLDRQDIESLGWYIDYIGEMDRVNGLNAPWKHKSGSAIMFENQLLAEKGTMTITNSRDIGYGNMPQEMYVGKIPSINELRTLMKWLGIK